MLNRRTMIVATAAVAVFAVGCLLGWVLRGPQPAQGPSARSGTPADPLLGRWHSATSDVTIEFLKDGTCIYENPPDDPTYRHRRDVGRFDRIDDTRIKVAFSGFAGLAGVMLCEVSVDENRLQLDFPYGDWESGRYVRDLTPESLARLRKEIFSVLARWKAAPERVMKDRGLWNETLSCAEKLLNGSRQARVELETSLMRFGVEYRTLTARELLSMHDQLAYPLTGKETYVPTSDPPLGTVAFLAAHLGEEPPATRSTLDPLGACRSNLMQIGLALHNYHDAHGTFPPAAIYDSSHRPMHSWRTLLLPFLDEIGLYNSYNTTHAWDSPPNRTVVSIKLNVYICPSVAESRKTHLETHYLAITGPGTAFPNRTSTAHRAFRDGASLTIGIVEKTDAAIRWAEPWDLSLSALTGTNVLRSRHKDGRHVLFFDGTVRFLPDRCSASQLRAFCTISGRETSEWDF